MEKDKIVFTEGFKYSGFKFAVLEGKLFRLPIKKDGRDYAFREVPIINITKKIKGYRIIRDKKSLRQIRDMVKKVNFSMKKSECSECL